MTTDKTVVRVGDDAEEAPASNTAPSPDAQDKATAEAEASDAFALALARVAEQANPPPPIPQHQPQTEVADNLEAEEPETVGLPATLKFLSDCKGTIAGNAFEVQLYAEACTECKHLIPSAEVKYDCHFTKGNPYCPAGSIKMVFVGERMRVIHKIRKAMEKKDPNRVLELMQGIADQPSEFKTAVLQAVGLLNLSPALAA